MATPSEIKDQPQTCHKVNKLWRFMVKMIKLSLIFSDVSSASVRETIMPPLNRRRFAEKSSPGQNRLRSFDRSVAASVGRCIELRRTLCGLSQQQLAARLGIDAADVADYEQGDKRISVKLLRETAKHLNANPTLFFQGQQ
jgi:ribosome-binding protein aMBF1 (putative translation factor)